MPNLGAGVDQHVNTAAVPTWVYNAPAYVAGSNFQATLRLYNEGTNTIFVGGANVTPFNGFPIPPGSKPVEIQNVTGTVYTCSNSFVTGSATAAATLGTGTGIATVGTTKLTVTTAAGIQAGQSIIIGTASNVEPAVVLSIATTVITLANPTLYYHAVGDVMTVATTTIGQLRVTAGT